MTIAGDITMRAAVFLLVLTLVSFVTRAGTVEEQLNQREEQFLQVLVRGDWTELEGLLAEGFVYNTANGTSLTKVAFLDYMKTGRVVVKRASRDQTAIRTYENVALVTGVVHVDTPVDGEDRTLHSRYLHVWVNEPQGWRLAARQATYLAEKQ